MVLTYNVRRCPATRSADLLPADRCSSALVLRISYPKEQLAAVALLLCAGITTYSPLRPPERWAGQKSRHRGQSAGWAYGHQAGPRHGGHVVAFATSESKRRGAGGAGRGRSGGLAQRNEMARPSEKLRLYNLTIVASRITSMPSTTLLKRGGTMTLVGARHAASLAGSV